MLLRAAAYSSSVSRLFSSVYSLCQLSLLGSKASDKPPQPEYWAKISCSSPFAWGPPSAMRFSMDFRVRMAVMLAENFSRGVRGGAGSCGGM